MARTNQGIAPSTRFTNPIARIFNALFIVFPPDDIV